MEEQAVKQQMQELIAQSTIITRKNTMWKTPRDRDYEYDMLYRNCMELEQRPPPVEATRFSHPRVGGACPEHL